MYSPPHNLSSFIIHTTKHLPSMPGLPENVGTQARGRYDTMGHRQGEGMILWDTGKGKV